LGAFAFSFGRSLAVGLLAFLLVSGATAIADSNADGAEAAVGATDAQFEAFLDRLMRAESNGHDQAANPRSTALGPFQFIKATFIELARRHFVRELAPLSDEEVLALRMHRTFARRAAAIYTRENLAYLTGQGLKPSFGDLRLAHLVGPRAAARLMQALPQTPANEVLGGSVIRANPFMRGMSASELIARAARDVGEQRNAVAVAPQPRERIAALQPAPRTQVRPSSQPTVTATCNQKLVVCRRWIAMQANKQRVAQQRQAAAKAAAMRKSSVRGRISESSAGRPGV
jgi:hypothetical protein